MLAPAARELMRRVAGFRHRARQRRQSRLLHLSARYSGCLRRRTTITARKTTAKAAQINRTIPDSILVLLFD